MSTNLKIKTMSDDLAEIEDHLNQGSLPKERTSPVKPTGNFPKIEAREEVVAPTPRPDFGQAVRPATPATPKKTNELEDIVNRVSRTMAEQREAENAKKAGYPQTEIAPAKSEGLPELRTGNMGSGAKNSTQDQNVDELKNLINRVSKLSEEEQEPIARTRQAYQPQQAYSKEEAAPKKPSYKAGPLSASETPAPPVASAPIAPVRETAKPAEKVQPAADKRTPWGGIFSRHKKAPAASTPVTPVIQVPKQAAAETQYQKQKEEKPQTVSAPKIQRFVPKAQTAAIPAGNLDSGIITAKKEELEKTESEGDKKPFFHSEYISPENRLILGRQERYSSIMKKINIRENNEDISGLKNVKIREEQEKILSQSEEYKKLKQSIVKKYHIKLFALPWKKIIPVGIFIVAAISFIVYYLLSSVTPPPPPPSGNMANGAELAQFADIAGKVEISKDNIKQLSFLQTSAFKAFEADPNAEIMRLVIRNDKNNIERTNAALADLKINTDSIPPALSKAMTEEYSILIFKTKQNSLRLALAIKVSDPSVFLESTKAWEIEVNEGKQMQNVLKPLFVDDSLTKNFGTIFKSSTYNNVIVRYIHLPDHNTSLNYFIYKGIVVFTTSKDSTYKIIDILASK